MWLKIIVFSVVVLSIVGQDEIVRPIVATSQGIVVGSAVDNGRYYAFYGVPYADSTSGAYRFKAPRPPPKFDAFVADRRGIKCIRALGHGYEGTEDCLVVNIFTPALNSTKKIPVIVWVQGSELQNREISFKNFMDQEVVVVSLNFRESIFGFLCLGTERAPGNAGLKDIVAGLQWVQQNIAEFGGDPDDVTLIGHGTGAAAVDLVILSPMTNGLVHKAIIQSGNAMAPWPVTHNNLRHALDVAESLGHRVNNIEELSKVFTRVSVTALMAVINKLHLDDNSLAFPPCLERDGLENNQPFMTISPTRIITEGNAPQIPLMIGVVNYEGIIRADEGLEDKWLTKISDSLIEFLQSDLEFKNSRQEVAQLVRSYYYNNPVRINNGNKNHDETTILISTLREVIMRTRASTAPVFLYQFSYKENQGQIFASSKELETLEHREGLVNLLHNFISMESGGWRDLTISDILVERWTNFAKTGVPSSQTSQLIWPPFTNEARSYLRIFDSKPVLDHSIVLAAEEKNPHTELLDFWDQVYEEHFIKANIRQERSYRSEDDVDIASGSGSGDGDIESGSGSGDGEIDIGDGSGSGEEDGNGGGGGGGGGGGNSASTAVGYTFLIVTLFTILNQWHALEIMS